MNGRKNTWLPRWVGGFGIWEQMAIVSATLDAGKCLGRVSLPRNCWHGWNADCLCVSTAGWIDGRINGELKGDQTQAGWMDVPIDGCMSVSEVVE